MKSDNAKDLLDIMDRKLRLELADRSCCESLEKNENLTTTLKLSISMRNLNTIVYYQGTAAQLHHALLNDRFLVCCADPTKSILYIHCDDILTCNASVLKRDEKVEE